MNEERLKKYQIMLEQLKAEIKNYLQKSEDSAAAVEPDKGLGRLSRMEAMQDQQMVLELRRRKKKTIARCGQCNKKDRRSKIMGTVFFAEIQFLLTD